MEPVTRSEHKNAVIPGMHCQIPKPIHLKQLNVLTQPIQPTQHTSVEPLLQHPRRPALQNRADPHLLAGGQIIRESGFQIVHADSKESATGQDH